MTPPFRVEVLGPGHDRNTFFCGVEALDHYLVHQTNQNTRRRFSACCVAVEARSGKFAGYYTLATVGVPLADVPEALPSGCLAIRPFRWHASGAWRSIRRSRGRSSVVHCSPTPTMRAARSEIAVFALVVDAKGDMAVAFYRHHGFEALAVKASS